MSWWKRSKYFMVSVVVYSSGMKTYFFENILLETKNNFPRQQELEILIVGKYRDIGRFSLRVITMNRLKKREYQNFLESNPYVIKNKDQISSTDIYHQTMNRWDSYFIDSTDDKVRTLNYATSSFFEAYYLDEPKEVVKEQLMFLLGLGIHIAHKEFNADIEQILSHVDNLQPH